MTIDETIKCAEEIAEENQRIVDTGIVFNDVTIDMLYCDDTEVIEEHLANYQRCAEDHRQLAEWLKDYKRLLEWESSYNSIKTELKQEPCKGNVYLTKEAYEKLCYQASKWNELEMCEDAISRQDVIELVKNSYYNLAESIEDTWAMVKDVEQLPSAKMEVEE